MTASNVRSATAALVGCLLTVNLWWGSALRRDPPDELNLGLWLMFAQAQLQILIVWLVVGRSQLPWRLAVVAAALTGWFLMLWQRQAETVWMLAALFLWPTLGLPLAVCLAFDWRLVQLPDAGGAHQRPADGSADNSSVHDSSSAQASSTAPEIASPEAAQLPPAAEAAPTTTLPASTGRMQFGIVHLLAGTLVVALILVALRLVPRQPEETELVAAAIINLVLGGIAICATIGMLSDLPWPWRVMLCLLVGPVVGAFFQGVSGSTDADMLCYYGLFTATLLGILAFFRWLGYRLVSRRQPWAAAPAKAAVVPDSTTNDRHPPTIAP